MARRNDHSRDEIQQMAIQAAIAILNQEGLGGLSTRKVASAIGYTAGTLYLVFRNLDELIVHVNAATLDEMHSLLAAQMQDDSSPQQIIKQMALAYLNYARANYARWSLLYTHQLPDGQAVPAWLDARVRDLFGLVGLPLQKLLPALAAPSAMLAIRVLWSGVHGACELGLNEKLTLGGEIKTEVVIDSLVENYLRGMTTE